MKLDLESGRMRRAASWVLCVSLVMAAACDDDERGAPVDLADVYTSGSCRAPARPPSDHDVRFERVYPSASIDRAIDMLQAPGSAAWWYVPSQLGVIYRFESEGDGSTPRVVLDLTERVEVDGEAGLLGMAFHPAFESNGAVYLSYTTPGGSGAFLTRVSRFVSADGGATLDGGSESVVFELEQPFGNHNGGDIGFGPDGMLYIGLGDGGSGGDPQGHGQNTGTLLGAMLRIDVDGGDPYAIPADNPFADGVEGSPEIFAWGLRNPWRWSFDRETGALWAGDVGQFLWEEVDLIERGGNYGWNVREGAHCYNSVTCDDTGLTDPVAEYRNPNNASVVAGYVYRGSAIPELVGAFIYSDFYMGTVYSVRVGEAPTVLLDYEGAGISAYGEGHDGELYALGYRGEIYRLARSEAGEDTFPQRLSETGCVNLAAPERAAEGLVDYALNVPFWSDDAEKSRSISLPEGEQIDVSEGGDWFFPPGTVLVKSFQRDGRWLETRLLMRHEDGEWAGYSYEWNEAQDDAMLLREGARREVEGGAWIFPSRGECLVCHTRIAGGSLGLETAQLDRMITTEAGETVDQLDHLVSEGLLATRPASPGGPLPALDGAAPLDARARGYLHANCAHCHQADGPAGRARFDARVGVSFAEMELCDVTPRAGSQGLSDARLVAPGAPERSVLSARLHDEGEGRMPAIGSERIDTIGAGLIDDWIRALADCP